MFILILWASTFIGNGEGNPHGDVALATTQFKSGTACRHALARVQNESEGLVTGVCEPVKYKLKPASPK